MLTRPPLRCAENNVHIPLAESERPVLLKMLVENRLRKREASYLFARLYPGYPGQPQQRARSMADIALGVSSGLCHKTIAPWQPSYFEMIVQSLPLED